MDMSPLWISIKVSVGATLLTFFLGILAARLVTGLKRGKFIIDSILSLPLVLPPTVVGFFLLILFGKNTAIGSALQTIGIDIVFTLKGAVIAATVVSFPIVYRQSRGAFELIESELIDAARTLGYNERQIFFKVWIPLSWPSLASSMILAFARALGEFGATIMIAGNLPGKTRTMSVAVYTAMQSGNREQAYSWVILILVLSFIILALMNFWSDRQYKRD